MKVDIFIDLSRMPVKQIAPLFEQLTCADGLGSLRLTYTAVLPDSADVPSYAGNWRIAYAGGSTQAAAVAAEEAGRQGRPLLFVLGGFVPSAESVAALLESLELDPLFGFAVPRMATHDGMGIEWQPLFPDEEGQSYLPRRAICDLPKYYIVPELVSPVVLVRSTVLANLRLSRSGFRTAAGALLHFLAKARRVGFRGVVHNRAVVPWCPKSSRTDTPDPADLWELLRLLPDSSCARVELAHLPWHTRERFLARAHSPQPDVRKSLLLDATAMGPSFNGTSECVLGLAGGLHALRHDWNVILAARPDAAEFHQLERRFPNWEIVTDQTGCRTTVAFKLSQPWAFRTMFELHQQALLNYYLVLDTIAWDVLFSAPENLDEIWRFSAQYADGLLYISDFTGSRFRTRFPLGPGVRDRTLYLSLHPRDYVRQEVPRRTLDSSRHLLVVGNSYDHKDLVQTVDTLAACFPFELIRAVGLAEATHPNVEAVASGAVSEEEMERLYAQARVVVFPSFYEGFGFPIIRGLSYGRPVIARQSDLLLELAAQYRGSGSLYSFSTHLELAEVLSSVLGGEPLEPLPLGTALAAGSDPLDWSAIASNMLRFFEESLAEPGSGRWLERENAIRQMKAYRSCTAG